MHLFSLKQFLPLANVLDVNYSLFNLEKRTDDGAWKNFPLDHNVFLIELLIPSIKYCFLLYIYMCNIVVLTNIYYFNLE